MSCLGTAFTFGAGVVTTVCVAALLATQAPQPVETPAPDYRPKVIYEDRTITKREVINNTPESCLRIPGLAEEYKSALFELNALITKNEGLVSQAQQAAGAGQSSADYISKTRDHTDQVTPLKVKAHQKRTALENAVTLCSQGGEG